MEKKTETMIFEAVRHSTYWSNSSAHRHCRSVQELKFLRRFVYNL